MARWPGSIRAKALDNRDVSPVRHDRRNFDVDALLGGKRVTTAVGPDREQIAARLDRPGRVGRRPESTEPAAGSALEFRPCVGRELERILSMSDDATAIGTAQPGEKNRSRPTRRDFLYLATVSTAVYGAAAVAWPLIDQMNPSADVIAAGVPIDVDLRPLAPGQQIIVRWQSHPIFIVDRTPQALRTLQQPGLQSRLRDPNSEARQQPPYAQNWHRSITPGLLVLVGICTHLGCIPSYRPTVGEADLAPNWPGGYFCPCHGSRYDLAGRVFQGVPAPYNLPVPPYRLTGPKTLRIGENPPGQQFSLASVDQM